MEFLGSPLIALWGPRVVSVLVGGAGGFLYYKYIGCKTGACPITGNPWISTLYGALLGWMVIAR